MIVVFLFLLFNSPAILLFLIGLAIRNSKPERAKILMIIAGVYFVVGLGVCGIILSKL